MKTLLILAVIAFLGFLYYSNPSFQDHKSEIGSDLVESNTISDELDDPFWKDLDYTNFFICSTTKSTTSKTMVSVGFMWKVKVVDNEWAIKAINP